MRNRALRSFLSVVTAKEEEQELQLSIDELAARGWIVPQSHVQVESHANNGKKQRVEAGRAEVGKRDVKRNRGDGRRAGGGGGGGGVRGAKTVKKKSVDGVTTGGGGRKGWDFTGSLQLPIPLPIRLFLFASSFLLPLCLPLPNICYYFTSHCLAALNFLVVRVFFPLGVP